MIVVASSDNESSQVRSVHLGLTRFLTMVEARGLRSLRLKTAWSSLTVWQFSVTRAKEANIIATRISLDVGFRGLKIAL